MLSPGCSRGLPPESGAADRRVFVDLAGREAVAPAKVERVILPRSKDIYLLASLLDRELADKLIAWGPDLAKDDAEVFAKLVATFPRLGRIPLTGSIYRDAVDPEQILVLRPDLVILDKFVLDRGYRFPARLEAAGLPVVYLDGSNDPFTGPQRGVELLGRMLGKSKRAEEIVRFVDEQIDLVLSRLDSMPEESAPSVYLEQGYLGPGKCGDTYGSLAGGGYTSWGTILHALRVRNIADGLVARQAPVQPELVLSADPEVIVITGQNWSNPDSMRLGCDVSRGDARKALAAYASRPGWTGLSAVKHGRVHAVFHNTCAITVFAGIQALAKACYPERFADLDPERNLREFHRRFLPFNAEGTWACRIGPVSVRPGAGETFASESFETNTNQQTGKGIPK